MFYFFEASAPARAGRYLIIGAEGNDYIIFCHLFWITKNRDECSLDASKSFQCPMFAGETEGFSCCQPVQPNVRLRGHIFFNEPGQKLSQIVPAAFMHHDSDTLTSIGCNVNNNNWYKSCWCMSWFEKPFRDTCCDPCFSAIDLTTMLSWHCIQKWCQYCFKTGTCILFGHVYQTFAFCAKSNCAMWCLFCMMVCCMSGWLLYIQSVPGISVRKVIFWKIWVYFTGGCDFRTLIVCSTIWVQQQLCHHVFCFHNCDSGGYHVLFPMQINVIVVARRFLDITVGKTIFFLGTVLAWFTVTVSEWIWTIATNIAS